MTTIAQERPTVTLAEFERLANELVAALEASAALEGIYDRIELAGFYDVDDFCHNVTLSLAAGGLADVHRNSLFDGESSLRRAREFQRLVAFAARENARAE